ncbi:unnamed protein product [Anisakis simplex]|uniref:DNTTIP1_dimer domain-containing protein n=1 Tax=Anisakis simplex TaxID=6269 RepID=A0A0M3K8C2_ANISI|nr:unnamed protein product [Anisakis simplex]
MFERGGTGNGNGNKMNLRVEILDGLLESMGEGSNAKINSLKQTIRRNKTDMAENTTKSLDLMRRVFQSEMTEEFRQILDRHVRTTFSPAFENLRRNGHEVSDEDIKELCRNILEAAKTPYLPVENIDPMIKEFDPPSCHGFDSDVESEASVMSIVPHQQLQSQSIANPSSIRGRKRGRPRKTDMDCGRSGTPIMRSNDAISAREAEKWDAGRISPSTRFILGSKVSRLLAAAQRGNLYMKYPRIFRYVGDEEDRAWLIENRLTTRLSGKIFVMILDDVLEIAILENYVGPPSDFERVSFCVPSSMVAKMKIRMAEVYEQLKLRVVNNSSFTSY